MSPYCQVLHFWLLCGIGNLEKTWLKTYKNWTVWEIKHFNGLRLFIEGLIIFEEISSLLASQFLCFNPIQLSNEHDIPVLSDVDIIKPENLKFFTYPSSCKLLDGYPEREHMKFQKASLNVFIKKSYSKFEKT